MTPVAAGPDGEVLSIGQVVARLEPEFPELTISKIRFLEAKGLIEPDRAPSGYRRFRPAHLAQLRWVLSQQRDHFLPLDVIADQLSTGAWHPETPTDGGGAAAPVPARQRDIDPLRPSASRVELSAVELRRRAGLEAAELEALEKVGLVEATAHGGRPTYDADALAICLVAARCLALGIEPRHLRAYKVAADREASLLLQRTGLVAQAERRDLLAELLSLGDDLRALLLRQHLADPDA